MFRLLALLFIGCSLFVNISGRPTETGNVELRGMKTKMVIYRLLVENLTPEQRGRVSKIMEIMLDRKMKAEEKFEAISTIPGVRDFSPEDRESIKKFLKQMTEMLLYFDNEIQPKLSPRAQKFFADMENLVKNFIPFILSSEEEQDKSIEAFGAGLELEDSLQILDAYLKIYKKAKDIGLIDQYIKMTRVKSITETTPLPMLN